MDFPKRGNANGHSYLRYCRHRQRLTAIGPFQRRDRASLLSHPVAGQQRLFSSSGRPVPDPAQVVRRGRDRMGRVPSAFRWRCHRGATSRYFLRDPDRLPSGAHFFENVPFLLHSSKLYSIMIAAPVGPWLSCKAVSFSHVKKRADVVLEQHINSPDPRSPPVIDPKYFGSKFGQSPRLQPPWSAFSIQRASKKMSHSMRLPPHGSASGCTPSRLANSSSRRTFRETTVSTRSTNGRRIPAPMRS